MAPPFNRVDAYDVKFSMRTKLHILKTIGKQLALKPNALNLFKKSVFGPWLNLQTEEHDNHMLHFLLLHQRRIENANTNVPFYFDIGHHALEFGRKEFCLLTGFKFGNISLKHFEDCVSSFRARVFPKIAKVKGYDIQPLIETDDEFKKLSDEDAVRVCLLFALEYVFMGVELRHVIQEELMVLVDDFDAWNNFPWGERIWKGFHNSVYNTMLKNREAHLTKIAYGSKPQCTLNGFVFPLKIWVLEIFPNSKQWWHTKEKSIPRCVSWSDGVKLQKADRESLFYSRIQLNTLEPTPKEMKTQWWSSSVEYFESASTGTSSSDIRGKKKKRKVVKTETRVHTRVHTTHVRTEIHSEVDCYGLVEASVGEKLVAMERDIGGRLAAIEEYLKIPKTSSGSALTVQVDDVVNVSDPSDIERKFGELKNDFQRRMLAIEQHFKPSSGSDHETKNKKIVDCSLDLDHEPNDKKTVDHDQEASRSSTKLKSDAEPFLAQSDKVENDKQMFEIVIPVSKDVLLETQSNEKLISEAENSLAQSEKFDYGKTGFETKTCSKTAEVLEDVNVAKLNVDPEILASTVKILFESPINDQRLNEQDVRMGDLFLEEEEQQKYNDLEVQELMAVDALMNIYVFDSTPKQEKDNELDSTPKKEKDNELDSTPKKEKDNELDTLSKKTDSKQGSDNENEKDNVLVVDDEQDKVKVIRVPFARDTKLSKYLSSPYTNLPDSTPQQPKLRDRTNKCKNLYLPLTGPDGEEIPPWKEDLNRVKGASKDRVLVPKDILAYLRANKKDKKEGKKDDENDVTGFYFPWAEDACVMPVFWERLLGILEGKDGWLSCTHIDLWVLYLWHVRPANADWVIAGPFFSTMILNKRMPCYYANGITYGTPWFAESVEKVYFPINQNENHWILAELHIRSGVITIYDSLCPQLPFIEKRKWLLTMRSTLEVKIPKLLQKCEVMDRKNIDKQTYKITFKYAENVPRQGNLYGDCGIWVMINLYRLTDNLSLAVENPTLAGLAYRERLTDFFWKYKIETKTNFGIQV